MSRVHALTTIGALALHLLAAAPWLHHLLQAPRALPPTLEVPVELATGPEKSAPARHRRAAKARTPVLAPTPAAARQAAAPAQPASEKTAAVSKASASSRPTPSALPTAAKTLDGGTPPSFCRLSGHDAEVCLLLHGAELRGTDVEPRVNRALRQQRGLTALFSGELVPLRDLDHLLLLHSGTTPDADQAVLQYNVLRYRVRAAIPTEAAESYALSAPQIVTVAASGAAPHVAGSFRFAEAADEAALELFSSAPNGVSLPLATLPERLRWLKLNIAADGSLTLAFSGASASSESVGNSHLESRELWPTLRALLNAAGLDAKD